MARLTFSPTADTISALFRPVLLSRLSGASCTPWAVECQMQEGEWGQTVFVSVHYVMPVSLSWLYGYFIDCVKGAVSSFDCLSYSDIGDFMIQYSTNNRVVICFSLSLP